MDIFAVLDWFANLPPLVTYLLMAGGAAIENIVPPVPADTFVLAGAFLAASGRADPFVVFLVTWSANVISELVVYLVARKWGTAFFRRPAGRWLLRPRQLERIEGFYDRWGVRAIAVSRFLPAFRAVVPVFAGVSKVSFARVAVPVAAASAGWYGALVFMGTIAGRNLERIVSIFTGASTVLLIIASVLIVLVIFWWWKSRHDPH